MRDHDQINGKLRLLLAFDNLTTILEWFGLVVFATTGALTASRKQMDMIGFVMLATVTGIGGGTLRDVLLGVQPVFWIREPAYLVVCTAVGVAMFFLAHIPHSRHRLILWLDAFGLALVAVTGAEKALLNGAGFIVATAMGVITGTFGGIIRDVLGREDSVILGREIYVTAAFAGAFVFCVTVAAGFPHAVALLAGFFAGFLLRAAALYWGWSLPRYRPRPGP